MQVLIAQLREFFGCFQPIVRKILRYGLPLVCALYAGGFFCRFAAGHIGNADQVLRLCEELLVCGKEMLGAVVIPALLLQLFYIAYAYDRGESLSDPPK